MLRGAGDRRLRGARQPDRGSGPVPRLHGQDGLQGDDQEDHQGGDPQEARLLRSPQRDGKILYKTTSCSEAN